MNICDIRDLDGPNIFLRKQAIILEVAAEDGDFQICRAAEAFAAGVPVRDASMQHATPDRVMSLVTEVINVLHDQCGVPRPETVSRPMQERHHYAVAFSWTHRRFAMSLGDLALRIVLGEVKDIGDGVEKLREILDSPARDNDVPGMIPDREGGIPIVAVAGIHGARDTTRWIASILRQSGQVVAVSSSGGVFIDAERVPGNELTGSDSLRRVLEAGRADFAVLECPCENTMSRGLAFEWSDVSVVTDAGTSVSGRQHFGPVEGTADVLNLVSRSTRPEGFAVLSADEPALLGVRREIEARPFLVTLRDMPEEVREHVAAGGWAMTIDDGQVQWWHDGEIAGVTSLNAIPGGGRASAAMRSILCAAAACLALGIGIDQMQSGLATPPVIDGWRGDC